MRSFMYTVKAPVGMHARHAGLLVQETRKYSSAVTMSKGEHTADARGILGLMGLGVKQGDVVTVTADGANEDAAIAAMEAFFKANL